MITNSGNISVWRGESTPPTNFHQWIKEDPDGNYIGTFTYDSVLQDWLKTGDDFEKLYLNDVVYFDKNNNVPLREKSKVLGINENQIQYELIGLNEYEVSGDIYDQIEVGSESVHLNLNTNNDSE